MKFERPFHPNKEKKNLKGHAVFSEKNKNKIKVVKEKEAQDKNKKQATNTEKGRREERGERGEREERKEQNSIQEPVRHCVSVNIGSHEGRT